MKVLLLKDVFKLGRAGDVKRVADGYGRNYLLPQGLAVLATSGALKQVDRIKAQAKVQRDALNEEMGAVAEQLDGMVLSYTERASETGKLYGSVNTQMIADSVTEKTGVEISRSQVLSQPLRTLGEHAVQIRLTVDLIPEVTVIVNSEGEEEEIIVMQEPAVPESDEDEEELQEEEQLESSAETEVQEVDSEVEDQEDAAQIEDLEEEADIEQLEEELESEDLAQEPEAEEETAVE
ncbi:MAG: 50S ribosomal protein L9 [Chloroflexota bacterium]|nr:MAG: 50S ribosomal protein L9 [Chloroflexota bacterium]